MNDSPDNEPDKKKEDTQETVFAGDSEEFVALPTMKGGKKLAEGDVILNRYRITGQLGRGGMGIVYRCYDEVGGIDVALKMVPPELARNAEEMEEIRQNFQLIEKLHHPNIAAAKTIEKDPETGAYYLLMECADGINLRRYRKKSGDKLTLEQAVPVLKQVASALDYAHSQKIIHRDIKPGNIMIDEAGTAKILDFGIASQLHETLSRMSHVHFETSGTTAYMAPEQWRGQYQNSATDQYALAVVTYELLGGDLPFKGHNIEVLCQAVLNQPPEPIPGLPPATWKALAKSLAKNRSDRFETCSEFIETLEATPTIKQLLAKKRKKKKKTAAGLPRMYKIAAAVFVLACILVVATLPLRRRARFDSFYESAQMAKNEKNWSRMQQYCDLALDLRPGDERIMSLLAAIPKIGHLKLTSEPPGAEVWFRGNELGTTPCTLQDLPEGKGLLVLRLDEHDPYETEIDIKINSMVKHHAPLIKQPGSIRVATASDGAKVWINGSLQEGTTPMVITNLRGRVLVKVEKDGFRSAEKNIDVPSGETMEVAFGDLTPRQGQMRIKSLPPGATVWLDNEQKGKTPLDLPQIPEGEHELVLALRHYEKLSTQIKLEDKGVIDKTFNLKALPASLAITSEPAGAEVLINGKPAGQTTPCVVAVTPGRLFFISVRLAGYGSLSKQVKPEPGISQSVNFTLEKLSGRIRITGIPAGSRIFLDGRSSGLSASDEFQLDDVPVGDHVVRIEKKGYEHIPQQNVNVSGGAVSALSFAQYTTPPAVLPEEKPEKKVETATETGKIEAVQKKKNTGTINIATTVPSRFRGEVRGQIILNGRNLGIRKLPYTVKDLAPGTYTVKLVGSLWEEDASRTVRISDSANAEVTVFFKSKRR